MHKQMHKHITVFLCRCASDEQRTLVFVLQSPYSSCQYKHDELNNVPIMIGPGILPSTLINIETRETAGCMIITC